MNYWHDVKKTENNARHIIQNCVSHYEEAKKFDEI